MVFNQGTLSSWSNTSGVSIGSLENHEQKSVGKLVQTLSMLRIMQSDLCLMKSPVKDDSLLVKGFTKVSKAD